MAASSFQHVDFTGGKVLEVIGSDEQSRTLRSHYFSNEGRILEYTYEVDGDTITDSIDMPNAKGQFAGRFNADGNAFTGRWEWTQDGEKMTYDAIMTKVQER